MEGVQLKVNSGLFWDKLPTIKADLEQKIESENKDKESESLVIIKVSIFSHNPLDAFK